jgi:hypothetical protein
MRYGRLTICPGLEIPAAAALRDDNRLLAVIEDDDLFVPGQDTEVVRRTKLVVVVDYLALVAVVPPVLQYVASADTDLHGRRRRLSGSVKG